MKRFVLAVLAILLPVTSAFAYDGAMVSLWSNSAVSVPNSYYSASYTKLVFPDVNYDTDGFWDASSNQFVIPNDIPAGTYGIISCHVRWQPTGGLRVQVLVSKYDASAGVQLHSNYPESAPDNRLFTGGTTTDHTSTTHPVLLEAGDAYSCQMWQQGSSQSSPALSVLQAGMSLQVLR
ncbi:MAG: hypothetical protein WC048_16730 [Rhizobium sp.]